MKTTDEIAPVVSEALDGWLTGQKQIIGIDGPRGAGKTSLLKYLSAIRQDIVPVYLDDFLAPRTEREQLAKETMQYEADWRNVPWFRYSNFQVLIEAFLSSNAVFKSAIYNPETGLCDTEVSFDLSRQTLVVEGLMLLRSPAQDRLDKLIYLDIGSKSANKRLEQRESKPEGLIKGFEEFEEAYLEQSKVKQHADLVIHI